MTPNQIRWFIIGCYLIGSVCAFLLGYRLGGAQ